MLSEHQTEKEENSCKSAFGAQSFLRTFCGDCRGSQKLPPHDQRRAPVRCEYGKQQGYHMVGDLL